MRDNTLKEAMSSLVKVLRELLANMEEEQQAILQQDAFVFQTIMQRRDSLIQLMQEHRKTMFLHIDQLKNWKEDFLSEETDKEILLHLTQLAGEEDVEVLTLRDQILALMEKMETQNVSLNSLLGNSLSSTPQEKVNFSHQFKPLKRRMQPKKAASQPKKITVKTMELNSEER